MKKNCILWLLIVALCLGLSGCGGLRKAKKQYSATYLTLFDTVTTVVGVDESEAAFREKAQKIHDALLVYHRLFDIYHEYEGINNLKTVNNRAGIEPVKVDQAILDLLTDCKGFYDLTGAKVNVAMGSVLSLWHEARNAALENSASPVLPDKNALEEAARHTDLSSVVIDKAASTVYITDENARLDVGAIAKGWAVQQVAENAPEGLLISVGGNVVATGPKDAQGTPWVVGIQDPDHADEHLHTILVTGGAVVTSGDYQRTYTVDGKQYHHIIDPETRMPGEYWSSVTVVCADSAVADALSTALFLLPLEEGKALAENCDAQVLWVDCQRNKHMTPGFQKMLRPEK